MRGVSGMQRVSWLAMSYNVPVEPSRVRVYVWRKLKELGAEYLRQGIAVMPNTAANLQQMRILAQKLRQMGGDASIVEMRFIDAADEREMTVRFQRQVEQEYQELLSDCVSAIGRLKGSRILPSAQEGERLRRMVKKYRRAKERDYFQSGAAGEIEEGLNELIESVREVAADFGKQLRGLLDG